MADEKPIINERPKCIIDMSDKKGLLLLSDIHYGIEINNNINVYNPKIATERMDNLTDKVIAYCKLHSINELYVIEMGDTISGHIHNNLRLENRMGVAQQVVGASELISNALLKLSREIPLVNFGMVEGNHDRILPLKDDNLNSDSFCVLVNRLIKERTKNIKNLNFFEYNSETYLQIRINNCICTFVHGDKDNHKNVIQGIDSITGTQSDYIFMGHYHSANEYTNNQTEIIVNGAFAGVDEYAINMRKNAPPIQKFIVFNNEGRECTYNIRVT